ncbi:MAG: tetratricopeptide repeat protein [Desulfomonile tiedjei]|nr:tetratricopeptide repeat protein [Desulfomonile tiedjei]
MASPAYRHSDAIAHWSPPWFLMLAGMVGWCMLWGLPGEIFAEGTFDRARSEVRAVHAQALLEEGRGECERGHHFRAIRVLSAALSTGAGPEAFQLRGQAYHRVGEFDKALADFGSAISLSPSNPVPYLARGDMFNDMLDYEKALIDFDKALELSPSSSAARLGRGLANTGLERYASAVNDFEAALSKDDRNPETLWNLGTAHMLAGRPHAAKKALQALLQVEADPAWKQRTKDRIAQLPPGPDLALGNSEGSFQLDVNVHPGSSQDTPPASPTHQEHPGVRPSQRSVDASRNPQPSAETPFASKLSITGNWEATYLGSRIKLNAQQSGSSLSGVLRIHGPGGGDDTYHFRGTVGEDGSVSASHHSGHRFTGRLLPGRRLSGVITTNDGSRIPLDLSPN